MFWKSFLFYSTLYLSLFDINIQAKMGCCAPRTQLKRGQGSKEGPQKNTTPYQRPIIRMRQQIIIVDPKILYIRTKITPDRNQKMKIKTPVDKANTKFTWKEQQAYFYPTTLKDIDKKIIRYSNFQEKLTWFRLHLESHRISWQQGSEKLNIDRWNILFSCQQELKKINLYKELKIQFNDEKVDDAGGLLRQWMHLCVKQIMSPQASIFKQCNTEQTAYKLYWDKNSVQEIVLGYLTILGLIVGKAIFQRISLNCYLDRTIIRQLCSQPIHIEDLYSYDREIYNSCLSILTMENAQQLNLDGCIYHNHGDNDLQQVQIIKNGKQTLINNENREQYISGMIQFYCTKSIKQYLEQFKKSVYKVIPSQLLSIFEPHQFEMILNGPQNIDVKDWRIHTTYQGFSHKSQFIGWFWEIVQTNQKGQDGLKNLLHYCTGSIKVPILGFKYLESNRSQVRPFTIRKVQYQINNPFPKAYTCFNRLEIPEYSTKAELKERMEVIMREEINNFGLS